MHTEGPTGSVEPKIPDTIKRPDATVSAETGKSYMEKLMQGVKDQLAALRGEIKVGKQASVSSTPGGSVGEAPSTTGISTPSSQTLNVSEIPHTTIPANAPVDAFPLGVTKTEPKRPSVSSTPGGSVGERPDMSGAGSGSQGGVGELPPDATGIPTPTAQHLDVGTIPHTYTPTNTPYDPFQ